MNSRIEQAIGQAASSEEIGIDPPISGLVHGVRYQGILRQKLLAILSDETRAPMRKIEELAVSLGNTVDEKVEYAVNLSSQHGAGLDVDTLDVLTMVAGHLHAIQVAITEIKKSLR